MRAPVAYRVLARTLPASFRREYGAEMEAVAVEHWRARYADAGAAVRALFWARQCASVGSLAVRLRIPRRGGPPGLRDAAPAGWLADFAHDARFAVRNAAKSPGFTVVGGVILALGVGANAALTGVTRSVLLDGLPYARARDLVRVNTMNRESGAGDDAPLSAGAAVDLREAGRPFARVSVFHPEIYEVIYRPTGGPRSMRAALVDAEFLPVLGVSPEVGRAFAPGEVDDHVPVVMLSHDLWVAEFGGDASLIGTRIRIDGDAWEVIGVLPAGFTAPMGAADFWFGMSLRSTLANPVLARKSRRLGAVARLLPGTDLTAARRELGVLADRFAREHPDTDAGWSFVATPLRRSMAGDARGPLLVLLGSAGLVLLIAFANLAGALLSKMLERREEFAVRIALGAGRGRIVRQVLTESGLLALGGGLAGVALAGALLALARRLPAGTLPAYARLTMDGTTVFSAVAAAVMLGALAGVPAALAAAAARSASTLRDGTRSATESSGRRRMRGMLVAGQIALCLSLLVGAGMLARSLAAMTAAPLGFDPDRVLTFSVKGPVPARDEDRRLYFDRIVEEIAALPGVRGVAHADAPPDGVRAGRPLAVEGVPAAEGVESLVDLVTVTDRYFEAMRIPLLRGRAFDSRDGGNGTPVAIVSASIARRYWPRGEAVGRRIRVGADGEWAEVIGVAGDVRGDPSRASASPTVYGSSRQSSLRSSRTYLVRTKQDPLAIAGRVRSAVAGVDVNVPMNDVSTLRRRVGDRLTLSALPAGLVAGFAILALLLASVGVYALYASMAAARRREYGVRLALGSTRAGIVGLAVRQGGIWMLVGFLAGVPASIAALRAIRGMLFGARMADPLVLGAAVLLVLAAAAIALLIPVRRAARVDALETMR